MEEWKFIEGFEGSHMISNTGQVKILARDGRPEKISTFGTNHRGYKRAHITRDGKKLQKFVHVLVAMAFIPKIEGKTQVNHKDGDKANNRVENLEWVSCAENVRHAIAMGVRGPRGKYKPHAKPRKPHTRRATGEIANPSKTGWYWKKKALAGAVSTQS